VNSSGKTAERVSWARRCLSTMHDQLVDIVRNLLSYEETQHAMTQWLRLVAVSSVELTKTHVDRNIASLEGFVQNCFVVAARIFSQEWEKCGEKGALLDPLYWLKHLDIGWLNTTPFSPTVGELNITTYRREIASSSSALSLDDRPKHGRLQDMFFLSLCLATSGTSHALTEMESIRHHLYRLKRDRDQMERQLAGAGEVLQRALAQNDMQHHMIMAIYRSYEAQMFQEEFAGLYTAVMSACCSMILVHEKGDDDAPLSPNGSRIAAWIYSKDHWCGPDRASNRALCASVGFLAPAFQPLHSWAPCAARGSGSRTLRGGEPRGQADDCA
jgi:hypothetical protein